MKALICVFGLLAALGLAAPVVVARVQDGETKQALAGAMVVSEGSDIMAVTDSSGRCIVVVAPRKGGALVASRQGYLDGTLTGAWPVKPGQDTVMIDFLLYPNRLGVGIIDAGARPAKQGARVSAGGSAPAESTRADGGSVLVEAKRTEAAEANLSLVDAANVGRVEGAVSDVGTGLSVAEARIVVEGTELAASTDSTGRYVIKNVPAGMHKLLVTCTGYVNAYTVVRLVKDWDVTVNLKLRKVEDPTGAPAPVK
ncbi:MAG: carboxypeptidase-like regulatory domain-containing protein [candidate division WOR-3 bacterium]|nr:carboxypeptidase-like regulatory domain-containing protein [candidate division WOR-3 bacterium]